MFNKGDKVVVVEDLLVSDLFPVDNNDVLIKRGTRGVVVDAAEEEGVRALDVLFEEMVDPELAEISWWILEEKAQPLTEEKAA